MDINPSGVIAPKPFSNLEWWYCFGFLHGDKGSKYAIVGSFFNFGELACFKGQYLIFSLIELDKIFTTPIP